MSIAQDEKKALRNGNESYSVGKHAEAANSYKRSLKEKQDYYKVNCEKRKQYQKQRYQKIKEQLDELKKLKNTIA